MFLPYLSSDGLIFFIIFCFVWGRGPVAVAYFQTKGVSKLLI